MKPSDSAAALASIVEGAVNEIGDRMVELDVWKDVRRILTPKFQPERHERAGSGFFYRAAACH